MDFFCTGWTSLNWSAWAACGSRSSSVSSNENHCFQRNGRKGAGMPELQTTESRYEQRDANVRVIAWFAAGLIMAALVMHLGIAGLYKAFEARYPSPDAPSRIVLNPRNIAPAPQLQTNPQTDFEE